MPRRVSPFGNPRVLTPAHGSPRLIAVSHALLRLLVPRHPPCALSSLTHVKTGEIEDRAFCSVVKVPGGSSAG